MNQASNTNGTLSKRIRPVTKRAQSGRRIMHIAQAISSRPTQASSKAADKAD